MRKTSDVIKMFSCVGLDCEIRALFLCPHTNPTANELSLTQIPLSRNFSFDGVKSHRWFRRGFGSHRSHRSHWIFLLMVLNLTEVGRWVVERVGVLWVLRVLRFPKLTQIIFVESRWICVSLREQRCGELLWDLTPGVQNCGLWDLCEPKGARVREASVRFSVRRAKLWDLWDLCEA